MNDVTTRLLRNGLAGDEQDYSSFVARITPLLIAVARRCGRSLTARGVDAEDIVQDAWLRCLPHLAELSSADRRKTPTVVKYLSVAVRRRARDLMLAAANAKAAAAAADELDLPDDTIGIVTRAVAAERDDRLLATIEALEPTDRDALVLLSIEQAPLDEAAEVLGISKDAAKQRHRRARQRLREQLPGSLFDELD